MYVTPQSEYMNLPRDRSLTFRGSKGSLSNEVRSSEYIIATLMRKCPLAPSQSQLCYCVQKRSPIKTVARTRAVYSLELVPTIEGPCTPSTGVAVARNGSLSLHIIALGQAPMAKFSMQFVSICWNSRSYRCQNQTSIHLSRSTLTVFAGASADRGEQGSAEPKQQKSLASAWFHPLKWGNKFRVFLCRNL
jgi:hypothetical protein